MIVDEIYSENGELFFLDSYSNILYKIGKNNVLILLSIFEKETDLSLRNNPTCKKIDNRIYCFPDRSPNVIVYDLNGDVSTKFELDKNSSRLSIYNSFIIDNYVWLVSTRCSTIFGIDLQSNAVEKKITIPFDAEVKADIEATAVDKKIYLISNKSKSILVFDTEKLIFDTIYIESDDKGYSTIAVINEEIYLTGTKYSVYCYNSEKENLRVVDLKQSLNIIKSEEYVGNIFYRSIFVGNCLVLVPENLSYMICDQLILLDLKTNEIKAINISPEVIRSPGVTFTATRYDDENILIFDNLKSEFYLVDTITGLISRFHIDISHQSVFFLINNRDYMLEDHLIDLQEYIGVL